MPKFTSHYFDGEPRRYSVEARDIYDAAEQFVESAHSDWDYADECEVLVSSDGGEPISVTVDIRAVPQATARRPRQARIKGSS